MMKELQNGSDIRGISLGENANLTMTEAEKIAKAFLIWLSDKTNKEPKDLFVAIGRDPRITGTELAIGLCEGLVDYGAHVYNAGLASTPAMFMATQFDDTNTDGAIMITASHLPMDRNGFKFFSKDGGLNKEDISLILKYAEEDAPLPEKNGSIEDFHIMNLYQAYLRNMIIKGAGKGLRPLKGLKICVDAGNGSGGFYAREILEPLGADISASQFLDPNGDFPNHQPNPENQEALASISKRVVEENCDFGLIFDTDVDRSAAVGRDGKPISRNGIIALAASITAPDHPGTTVVTDSITSPQLKAFLEQDLKLKHYRYRRGYRNIINKAIELGDSALAAETSGHVAFKDNYFLDDGAYLAARIVIEAAKGRMPEDFIKDLQEPVEATELRLPLDSPDFQAAGDRILSDLTAWAKEQGITIVEPNYEGVRLDFGHGWCLLRKSLHEPLLPLNIESDKAGGVEEILECMTSFLKRYEEVTI